MATATITRIRHVSGTPLMPRSSLALIVVGASMLASCGSSDPAAAEVGGLTGRNFEVAMDFSELPDVPPMATDCYRFVDDETIISDLYPDFDAEAVEEGTWQERLDGARTTFTAEIPAANGLVMNIQGAVELGDGDGTAAIELRGDLFVQGNPIAVVSGSGTENSECVSNVPG